MNMQLILDFLSELKENNNKAWMDANKKKYNAAKEAFEKIVKNLIDEITLFDSDMSGLEAKKCIFRINRDIRFSADKSPYKLNFGAFFQKGGKKSNFSGYYVHIQPEGESFLGGGIYMPMPPELAKIRQEIDYNLDKFKTIVEDEEFKKYFGELWGEKVKTTPKSYEKDNPAIEYLKLKSFTAFQKLSEEQIHADNFVQYSANIFKAIKPLNDFLNTALEN